MSDKYSPEDCPANKCPYLLTKGKDKDKCCSANAYPKHTYNDRKYCRRHFQRLNDENKSDVEEKLNIDVDKEVKVIFDTQKQKQDTRPIFPHIVKKVGLNSPSDSNDSESEEIHLKPVLRKQKEAVKKHRAKKAEPIKPPVIKKSMLDDSSNSDSTESSSEKESFHSQMMKRAQNNRRVVAPQTPQKKRVGWLYS